MIESDAVAFSDRYGKLCQSAFSTAAGRELLKEMQRIFVEGQLYQDTDRETVYCIAQRDFVLEILDRIARSGEFIPTTELSDE